MSNPQTSEPVVLINTFQVPPEEKETFVEVWRKHADALVDQPGFITTELHSSLSPDSSYSYVNIAKWQSVETFKTAIGRPEFKALGRLTRYQSSPGLYSVAVTY